MNNRTRVNISLAPNVLEKAKQNSINLGLSLSSYLSYLISKDVGK